MRLRQILKTLVAVLVLSFTGSAPADATQTVLATVEKVSDGDTLTGITRQGAKLKVRLYGIDAPEVPHPGKPGQPWGENAKAALEGKINKKAVALDVIDIDQYKRVVAVVRIDNRDINREMVREGNAWAYRQYLGRSYASEYLAAEEKARSERIGIWKERNPQPPWEFRRLFK